MTNYLGREGRRFRYQTAAPVHGGRTYVVYRTGETREIGLVSQARLEGDAEPTWIIKVGNVWLPVQYRTRDLAADALDRLDI